MSQFQIFLMDDQADFNKYLLELETLVGFGRAHYVADDITSGGNFEKTGSSERLRKIVAFCKMAFLAANLPNPDEYLEKFEISIDPPDIDISILDIDFVNLFYQNWKSPLKFKIQNGKWIFCPEYLK